MIAHSSHLSTPSSTCMRLIREIDKTEVSKYWRLFFHHLACSSFSDLFITELILFNVGIHVERLFGSVKFAVSRVIFHVAAFLTRRFQVLRRCLITAFYDFRVCCVVAFQQAWPELCPTWPHGRTVQHPVSILETRAVRVSLSSVWSVIQQQDIYLYICCPGISTVHFGEAFSDLT